MNTSEQLQKIKIAAAKMTRLNDDDIKRVLHGVAGALVKNTDAILKENIKDLERMDPSDPKYDRLKLTKERIEGMAGDVLNVMNLPSPLGIMLEERTLPNGLELKKVSVPLGVVGVIYEARPNVTTDVFSLTFKAGNACVLKGGSDAMYSNAILTNLIKNELDNAGVDSEIIQLLSPERQAAKELMEAVGFIDILIPRGSQNLIDSVRENSKVPVIETGAGIVHTYFDKSGDLEKGKRIVFNAKTRRVSVCNALDCLIVHKERLSELPELVEMMAGKNVEIFADKDAFDALDGKYPAELLHVASPEHFGTEFLSYKMALKTVASLDEALDHIARYSSKHSEAIIAEDEKVIEVFYRDVDAAAVYANTSTAFTDGAQFGMGAEIGISTQKLHARGPMALRELTSYKWIIKGNGQVRD
ncbi:MAG: glutamate-5-semialdehyde dehydrogenase [Chlorobi bacterium]|nr:glutamate-5-semialdehyde dehydrogenase [Chlorobiota bacterium]